jgi:pimeloyl-ACP methyl ester carboxylesterase
MKMLILCAGFSTCPVPAWLRPFISLLPSIVFRFKLPSSAMRSFLTGRNAPESLLREVRDAVSSVRPQVLAARMQAILACDVRKDLARVKVPILYLRGTEDNLVPARCTQEILRINPDAEVISIAGPHLLIQREPRRCAEAVLTFLRQLEGVRTAPDSKN